MKKKYVVIAILGLAALSTGLLMAARGAPKAAEVQVQAVGHADIAASVSASGQIQPRVRVNLSSDISGRIVEMGIKEGDMVTKGQVLLRIDSAQYQAAYERAQANLASVNAQALQTAANALQTQRNLERSEQIAKGSPGAVTAESLEQLRVQAQVQQIQADASKYSVQQAEAGVRDAKNNLEKTIIFAPMTGRITRLNVQEGETAIVGTLNKDAAALLTISDMSVLETSIRVDETEVTRIALGDSAVVQIDAFPDTSFVGKVTAISNSSIRGTTTTAPTAAQSVDFEVTIQLLNPPKDTRPDFSATAKVITAVRKNVVAIPISGLTVRDNTPTRATDTAAKVALGGAAKATADTAKRDQEGVFVLGTDNKVTFRPVTIGITGETNFEVLDGLREGERIVTGPFQAVRDLKDGALVRERPATPPVP